MDLELEQALRDRLNALPLAARAELLHVLTMPDYDRAGRIGEFYTNPKTRTFAELLIDCEEDKYLRAVLVGMLRGPLSTDSCRVRASRRCLRPPARRASRR